MRRSTFELHGYGVPETESNHNSFLHAIITVRGLLICRHRCVRPSSLSHGCASCVRNMVWPKMGGHHISTQRHRSQPSLSKRTWPVCRHTKAFAYHSKWHRYHANRFHTVHISRSPYHTSTHLPAHTYALHAKWLLEPTCDLASRASK